MSKYVCSNTARKDQRQNMKYLKLHEHNLKPNTFFSNYFFDPLHKAGGIQGLKGMYHCSIKPKASWWWWGGQEPGFLLFVSLLPRMKLGTWYVLNKTYCMNEQLRSICPRYMGSGDGGRFSFFPMKGHLREAFV